MSAAGIYGVGQGLPSRCVTNEDLVAGGLDTSDQWIFDRTGIRSRWLADSDTATSDLALMASQQALERAGVLPTDIDLLIVATTTPDFMLFPSTACVLQDKLGLNAIGAMDVSAACSGFSYAVSIATAYVKAGMASRVLVVAADCLSKYLDWSDRSVCVLFGDGAGAVVIGPVRDGFGVIYSRLYSKGSLGNILNVPSGGSRSPITPEMGCDKSSLIYMNGRQVFRVAIDCVAEAFVTALAATGLTLDTLDWFLPHQANLRLIQAITDRLGFSMDKTLMNIEHYGNTSAASIPIMMAEAASDGRLKEGQTILTIGFGAGFTWGVQVIRWGGREGI